METFCAQLDPNGKPTGQVIVVRSDWTPAKCEAFAKDALGGDWKHAGNMLVTKDHAYDAQAKAWIAPAPVKIEAQPVDTKGTLA